MVIISGTVAFIAGLLAPTLIGIGADIAVAGIGALGAKAAAEGAATILAESTRQAQKASAAAAAAAARTPAAEVANYRSNAKTKSRLNSAWARRGPIRDYPTGNSKWAMRM